MQKAAREAKTFTSWTSPNVEFEAALRSFVAGTLADPALMADLRAFVEPLVTPGRINALAQTLLKLTAPGVPDLYQGTELWSLDLVDPDNRRPVDYTERRRMLAALETLSAVEIWQRADDGLPKLWVIQSALALRRRRPEAFGPKGAYAPLRASGRDADGVLAFVRGEDAVTVAPRLSWSAREREAAIALPHGVWRNVLTGGHLRAVIGIGELWREFPVALLEREGGS
jgi:(1->4)-alpha-D-glucan 1-alpha-D-glucosylmutase